VPKLRILSGKQTRAILESNGWVYSHHNGSHMIMKGAATISVPDHKELTVGTLGAIIRQSGIGRGPFEA
jgi:predicted RNA binding protein YcfA (HicA-like mRNA interferase family)